MDLAVGFVLALSCLLLAPVRAQDVAVKDYPFMAVIARGQSIVGNGAIIAPRWVITTATTVYDPPDSVYIVIVGVTPPREYRPFYILKHPQWKSYEYNVAMLRMEPAIMYQLDVQGVQVASSNPNTVNAHLVSFRQNKQYTTLQAAPYQLTSEFACINKLTASTSKTAVAEGQAYCVTDPKGVKRYFWTTKVGASAVADNELMALLSVGDFEEVPYDLVATRLGFDPLRQWIENHLLS